MLSIQIRESEPIVYYFFLRKKRKVQVQVDHRRISNFDLQFPFRKTMASNRFFLNDGSSSSEESTDDEQVQVQPTKKGAGKGAAKPYVSFYPTFVKAILQFRLSALLNHISLWAMTKKMSNVLFVVKKKNGKFILGSIPWIKDMICL